MTGSQAGLLPYRNALALICLAAAGRTDLHGFSTGHLFRRHVPPYGKHAGEARHGYIFRELPCVADILKAGTNPPFPPEEYACPE